MDRLDIESIDDLALRLSEQCRNIINEGLVGYFTRLMIASGQRPARVMKKPAERGPALPVAHPTKKPRATKANKLIALLEQGPQFVEDLMSELDANRAQLNALVHYVKNRLGSSSRKIRYSRGNKGKGSMYALRRVEDEE